MKKKSLLSRSSFSSSPRATIIISKLAVTTYLSRNDPASTLPRLSSSSRSFISHYYVVPKIRSSFNFQHAQFSLQSPARAEKNFFTPVIFLIGEIIVGDHVVGPPRRYPHRPFIDLTRTKPKLSRFVAHRNFAS